jgi:hypothetical protein
MGCFFGVGPGWDCVLTRLKRLPVISREHFRKTRTNYFYKHLFGISNTKLQNRISNTSALKGGISIPIVTSKVQMPIVTSNTNCYFKYQLLLQIPMNNDPPRTTTTTTATTTTTTKWI